MRKLLPLIAAAILLLPATLRAAEERPPNVIFLLVDDLGWTDIGTFGTDFYETPNIDRLAASGMKFTDGYAACTVCSPTRAAAMTGMYPARLHVTDWIAGHRRPNAKLKVPDWTMKLEHRHTTIAEALAADGYRTAHFGKWHLTPPSDTEQWDYTPDKQGFELNIGGNRFGAPGSYFHPYTRGKNRGIGPLPPGGKEGDYLTDRLTDEAVKVIEKWKDEPFYIYFPYYNVHTPLQGKADLISHYKSKLKPGLKHTNTTYAAMVHSVDDSVGRLLATLDRLGIAENTVIFFTGDNGGLEIRGGPTDNDPLRAGKGSAYEGGVRVPTIATWPGVTKPGSVCDEPVITVDYYPTILELTGVQGNKSHNADVDGLSLVPVMKDSDAQLDRDAIYWHYPHYHPGGATPYGAVRQRDWKLIEFYEDMQIELYNLAEDIGETNELSDEMPEKACERGEQLHTWRKSVGAQMPTPNE